MAYNFDNITELIHDRLARTEDDDERADTNFGPPRGEIEHVETRPV